MTQPADQLLTTAAKQAQDASNVLIQAATLASEVIKRAEAQAIVDVAAAAHLAAEKLAHAATEAVRVVRETAAGAATVVQTQARVTAVQATRTRPVLTWLSAGTLAIAACLLGTMLWWMLYPYRGVTSYAITSQTGHTHPGGLYSWTVSYCVAADVPLPMTLDREIEIVDHQTRYPLPTVSYIMRSPCETFTRSVLLPDALPAGLYRLIIHTAVRYNPMRVIAQDWTGDVFEVQVK
jgi:hypothetical protein